MRESEIAITMIAIRLRREIASAYSASQEMDHSIKRKKEEAIGFHRDNISAANAAS